MNTPWFRTPLVRVLASALSWFLFVTAFTLLFQTASVVVGLGGFCASGGPYEIAVECPESVALWAPLTVPAGFVAVGIGLFFSGGFGTQLGAWGWGILFVGLAVPFAVGGGVGGWLTCVLFVVMGLAPIVLELRANAARTLLGTRNAAGEAFAFADNSRRSIMSMSAPAEGTVPVTAGAALLAVGVPAVAAALGVWAGILLF